MSKESLGAIAFGLYGHPFKDRDGLIRNFAKHVCAREYSDIYGKWSRPTEEKLESLMYGAATIHFNLDGVVADRSGYPKAIHDGSLGMDYRHPNGWGNITNWELWRICQDDVQLDKTHFYLDGSKVSF